MSSYLGAHPPRPREEFESLVFLVFEQMQTGERMESVDRGGMVRRQNLFLFLQRARKELACLFQPGEIRGGNNVVW